VEAVIKRERALAYAYSHQVRRSPRSSHPIPSHGKATHELDRPPKSKTMVRRRCSAGVAVSELRLSLRFVMPRALTETDALFVCCPVVPVSAAGGSC
jgi:hypothetical protein